MKRTTILLILLVNFSSLFSQDSVFNLSSPNGKIKAKLNLSPEGIPTYAIDFNGKPILGESTLGIMLSDGDFTKGLKIESVSETKAVHDEYKLFSGKRKQCIYNGNERTIRFSNSNHQPVELIFRISDDGAAFRYFLPEKSETVRKIIAENTSFQLTSGSEIYMSPCPDLYMGWCNSQPSYEDYYFQSELI